jgi:DNA-binding transcriptional LysR family regulator
MSIDPRHVTLVLAISDHGSFSAAAAALNTSQPALSNRIAMLERELGAKVFVRNRFGVTLTEIGQLLLRHARAIDASIGQICSEIEMRNLGVEGPVTIGSTPVSSYELIPRALGHLSDAQIALSVVEDLDEVLMEKLRSGELDLLVGTIDSVPKSIVQEPLAKFSAVLAVSASNKLAARRSISLAEVSDLQWAVPSRGGAYWRYLEAMFINNGVPFPQKYWTFGSAVSLKGAVQHTNCVAILPRHFMRVEERAGVLKAIRLIDTSPSRSIGVMYDRSRVLSPVAERFKVILHQVADKIR